MVAQVLQLLGALAVLAAFILVQTGATEPSAFRYLVLNLLGSGLLAVLALISQQWGFLLLEGAWAIVSGSSLAKQFWFVRRT